MLSQISNTASKSVIEQTLNATFDYGYLYRPKFIINGLKESSLCIITANATDRIQYGIWGILPKGYRDSWVSFQSVYNTLEVEFESIPQTSWLFESLKYRRCLIVATGFFSSELEGHTLQTFHNVLKDEPLFCFAGIYNVLEDGFLSCSILTHHNGSSSYHLKSAKPIIIGEKNYQNYLNKHMDINAICEGDFEMNRNQLEQFEVTASDY